MKGYTIVGFDPETYEEPTPVRIDQYFDRQTRSWITLLLEANDNQVGDAAYDGTRADARASLATMRKRIVRLPPPDDVPFEDLSDEDKKHAADGWLGYGGD